MASWIVKILTGLSSLITTVKRLRHPRLMCCLICTAILFACSAAALRFYGGIGLNRMVSIFGGLRVINAVVQNNSTGPGVSVQSLISVQAVDPT
jgi:hypothetical protein